MESVKIMNHGNRLLQLAIYGLVGCAFWRPLPAPATVTNISIVNFAFTPNSVSINVNDSVKWTWAASTHSTTSDTGLWESGVLFSGATFTHTFTSTGSFPFFCSVHPFMTGTVGVQSANVPPTVGIINPTNGSVLAAPATFTLTATASDSDGNVTNVQFLQGAVSLGTVVNSQYSVLLHNLAPGNYTFSAVATDNNGSQATNSVTMRVVTPAPIILSAAQKPSRTSFQFSYSATAGLSYLLQRSGDLTQWIPLSTNTARSGSEVFLDQNASGNASFYRVGLLPNP